MPSTITVQRSRWHRAASRLPAATAALLCMALPAQSTWMQARALRGVDTWAVAHDTARGRSVLLGTNDPAPNGTRTWEWDGSTWTQRTPTTDPGPRGGHGMTEDPYTGNLLVYGGHFLTPVSGTWQWDGNAWTQLSPTISPPAFSSCSMAYDLVRRRAVLFAGPRDTWMFGDLVAPAAVALGTGCPGTNGPPVLSTSEPFLGAPGFTIDLQAGRAASPCTFALAGATQALSLGGGCTLYVRDPIATLVGATNGSGVASLRLTIPDSVALRGAFVYAQAAIADPLGAFSGLAFTGGLQLKLGD